MSDRVSESKIPGGPDEVELGEEVTNVAPRSASTVAVRVSSDLLARITDYAQLRGLTLSDVLRTGAELLLAGNQPIDLYYVSGPPTYGRNIHYGPAASAPSPRRVEISGVSQPNVVAD